MILQRCQFLVALMAFGLLSIAGCTEGGSSGTAPASGDSGSATANAGTKKRIILLNNTDSPFWDAARAGIAKAVEDLKLEDAGFTAGMDTNSNAEEGQIEKLRQYATQDDIVAVIISPTSAPTCTDAKPSVRRVNRRNGVV